MTAIKIFTVFIVLFFGATLFSGCGVVTSAVENVSGLVGLNETGTVIAPRAQIRSSYAVVAADLLEVKRGEALEVLDTVEFEKVRWYRVRANDEDKTEGWIEAQNLIISALLEKSKKIADEDKDSQPQATGQIRAATNLRTSPEQRDDNILVKLDNLSTFEIVSWRFVPKVRMLRTLIMPKRAMISRSKEKRKTPRSKPRRKPTNRKKLKINPIFGIK